MNTDLQYPIGRVQLLEYSDIVKDNCLKAIQGLPIQLDYAVENLNDTHLHTPYRWWMDTQPNYSSLGRFSHECFYTV